MAKEKTAVKMEPKNMVPQLRECSFKPEENLSPLEYKKDDGTVVLSKELYLKIKYRVLWFHTYCHEKNYEGYIDDSDISIMPELGLVIAKCSVYIKGECVGKSTSGKHFQIGNVEQMNTVVQTAATMAKGRALANAGFGTLNSQKEDGELFPCDEGITVLGSKIVIDESNPMLVTAVEEDEQPVKKEKEAAKPSQKSEPVSTPEKAAREELPPPSAPTPSRSFTLEEALAYEVKLGKGKTQKLTLGELVGSEKNMIKFYADEAKNRFERKTEHPDLHEAAKVVYEHLKSLGQF